MTSEATRNAISSPASVVGPSPSDWPVGTTRDLFGLDHVPASPSVPPASRKAPPTSATSGPSFDGSSPSAALQRFLENRLRLALGATGFAGCVLTWKHVDMLSEPPSFQLSASVPRIDASGNGLLPTPSGTSNHGKNHVSGRLDEWGGSSNPFRGTAAGKLHLPALELWMMGFPDAWRQLMPLEMQSSRKSPRPSSAPACDPALHDMEDRT